MTCKNKFWFRDIFLIFVAGVVLFFAFAKLRPLSNPDEGRYAEIPREMISNGDYITPRLNALPYFYKPPLFYWMQCVSLKTFGINRISVRLANSLMAIFGVCITYVATRALYGRRAGVFSAGVLLATLLYYVVGSMVTLDMTVSVFISVALFSFIVGIKKSGIWRKILIVCFFIFCAMAVMTKGVIGILIPSAVVLLYVVGKGLKSTKDFLKILKENFVWCIIVIVAFFVITVPWHIAVGIANPALEGGSFFSTKADGQGFLWYYFVHEHFLRYVDSSSSLRGQPFWFFLVIAPVGFLPWALFLPRALKNSFKKQSPTRDSFFFMAVWIVFIVAFFSMSGSKLVPYITAIYPALAFIIGVWLSSKFDNIQALNLKPEKYIFTFFGYLVAIVAIVAIFVVKESKVEDVVLLNGRVALAITSVCMFVISTVALRYALKSDNKKFLYSAYVGVVVILLSLNPSAAMWQRVSSESMAEQIKQIRTNEHIAVAFDYELFHDLPLWLGEELMYVGYPVVEQRFGWKREQQKHSHRILITQQQLYNFLKQNKKLWVVLHSGDVHYFDNYKMPLQKREILRCKKNILLEISLKNEK